MEVLESCYKSKMRLFRDRPDVLVAGRWYWCPPGAVAVPFLHRFGSMHFDYNDFDLPADQVGEVEVIPGRTSGIPNARYTGQRWCGGEEVWTQGTLFAQQGTPPTDPDGVPLCCLEADRRGGEQVEGEGEFAAVPGPGMLWQPEGLDGFAVSDPISTWVDSTGNGHDGIPVGAPQRPVCAIGPGGHKAALLNRITAIPFANMVAWPFMSAYIVATPLGAGLQRCRPRLGGLGPPGNTAILNGMPNGPNYRDTISTASAVVPIETGITELLSYRRNGTHIKFARNGETYLVGSIDLAGEQVFTTCSLTTIVSPFTGTALLSELRIYPVWLTDAEDAEVLAFLAQKYQLNLEINDVIPGTVLPYAGPVAPGGYLLCDGAAVSRTTYAQLFSYIGETWGSGDGSTTFNVPDFRGRVLLGDGSGPGLSTYTLADLGGEEAHQLTTAELAAHTHGVTFPADGVLSAAATARVAWGVAATGTVSATSDPAGSNNTHENRQPYAAVLWIIKT